MANQSLFTIPVKELGAKASVPLGAIVGAGAYDQYHKKPWLPGLLGSSAAGALIPLAFDLKRYRTLPLKSKFQESLGLALIGAPIGYASGRLMAMGTHKSPEMDKKVEQYRSEHLSSS